MIISQNLIFPSICLFQISVLPDTKVQEISQKLQEELTNFNKLTKEGNMEEARAMAIDLAVGADALYNSITATVYNCSSDDEVRFTDSL